MTSGYTDCACPDCFDIAVSDDMERPGLCGDCEAAGCDGEGECCREDAYGCGVQLVTTEGVRVWTDEDGESRIRWALFSLRNVAEVFGCSEAEQREVCLRDPYETAAELTGWERHYGQPGQWYWERATLRIRGDRVLVKQRGGYDI